METKKYSITKKAREIGFDLVGFSRPEINSFAIENYKTFLKKNYNGQMKWLEKHFEKKTNPKKLWNKTQTILVLGINYGPKNNPLINNKNKTYGNVSVYARNKDYHDVIRKKLELLKNFLSNSLSIESKYFVDSAPVFEKTLAQQSGLGWVGKHTNLVSKKIGSWFFLAEVYLSKIIPHDKKEVDHCGSCDLCLKACPTNAIISEYTIDARKCISYLTIEHKGPIARSLRKKIGNKIFGCDDCLAVCPWNKFGTATSIKEFKKDKILFNKKLEHYLKIKRNKFKEIFNESPIYRIGWITFIRNVLIAVGNSKKKKFIGQVKNFLSNDNSLIRGTAIWSLSQLVEKDEMKNLKDKYIKTETNKYVIYEWNNY